jgi:hypothetical protein
MPVQSIVAINFAGGLLGFDHGVVTLQVGGGIMRGMIQVIDDGPVFHGFQLYTFGEQPPFDVHVLSHSGADIVFVISIYLQQMLF